MSLYPSLLDTDQVAFWGEGTEKLALAATLLPEVTPHLEEGGMRNSYAMPALSINETSGSLRLPHKPPVFYLLYF